MENEHIKNLPYQVHTNRELEMMLNGSKPLAIFCDDVSVLPDELIIPEKAFEPHIQSERFLRAEKLIEGSYIEKLSRNAQLKTVIFCLADEEWRINAMFLLKEQLHKTGKWNETCERVEGKLLGYTDDQNDIWCAEKFNR